ncbi:MAG: hypothetical protein JWO90_521 [Solirubrobacterales bacterium]|jgi:tetratricopeptide (TPR) repeat protein|nr:hypothetical protein [Solirubrobacterales bacterium]
MLFDLRGRGRRRTVQVIYLSLAILMGGGLVLLGIGGGTSGGGLLDAFTNGSSAPDSGIFGERREAAEKRVQANRQDPKAWAELARARYQEATAVGGVDEATGVFSSAGKQQLAEADRAWKQYLKLDPPQPDATVAVIMAQVYSPAGLDRPDDAVAAQEVVAEQREDVGSYLQLAGYAYAANQSRKGDLAGDKAIALATKDQKEQIKAQVEGLKSQAAQAAVQEAQQDAPATGTTG